MIRSVSSRFRTFRESAGGSRAPRQRRTAAGDARPDGPRRDVEDLGDLGVVEVAQVTEHHRDPELLGQVAEGGVDVEAGVDRVVGVTAADAASRRRLRPVPGAAPCAGHSSSAAFVATR